MSNSNWDRDPFNIEFRLTRLKEMKTREAQRDAIKKDLKAKHAAELKSLEEEFMFEGTALDDSIEQERKSIQALLNNWMGKPYESDTATVKVTQRKQYEITSISELLKWITEHDEPILDYFQMKKEPATLLIKRIEENSGLPDWSYVKYNPVLTVTFNDTSE